MTQATSGCRNALTALARPIQVSDPTSAPIANVIAASWNAGMVPVATVITDKSDHIRIAVSPIRVAVGGVIQVVIPAREETERTRNLEIPGPREDACPGM